MRNYRLLLVVNSLAFGSVGVIVPLISLYLQSLGADLALISVMLTSGVAVALAANFGWGWLADRTGRRKPFLIVGLVGTTLGLLWLSQSASLGMAWGARLFDGLCFAAVGTLGLTLVGDSLEDSPRKGRAIGLMRGLGSLLWAVGAAVGGRLADAYGFSTAFLFAATLVGTAALVALLLRDVPPTHAPLLAVPAAPETPIPVAEPLPLPARTRLAGGLPWLFLAGVVIWTAVDYASSTMWPNYLASLGYTKSTISGLASLAALVEMPSLYLLGSLSDTIGRTILLAVGGFGIALIQVAYILFVQVMPILLGVQVARGVFFGSYTASAMTYAAERAEQARRGSSSGLFFATSSAGQLLGTLLGGTVAQAFGFTTLYALLAVLAAISGVCFLALRRGGERVAAA